jgi:DNA (cytosine-5)-methyltransferase 1
MRYLSLFSGLEGATLAWHHLGWKCVATAEIEPAARAVLADHYPDVPNLGDISKVTEQQIHDLGHIDIVVFGSPCQDVSIAGKREGMEGSRSGLFFTAMRVVRWSGARFGLWENVPGVFSDHQGRGFASVAGEMAGIHVDVPKSGWRNSGFLLGADALVEWAVLDAQFFGVPQRRRRVFALRDSGDWASRPPILLESESLQGHPAPRRETRKDLAPTLSARTHGGGRLGTDFDLDGGLICDLAFGGNNTSGPIDVSTAANACATASGRIDFETETFIVHSLSSEGFDASEDGTGRGTPLVSVAQSRETGKGDAAPLTMQGMQVRRLTPRECERLQGVPDGYTLVERNGKPMADGPRYKMLGNGFAVPVVRWIGERLAKAVK